MYVTSFVMALNISDKNMLKIRWALKVTQWVPSPEQWLTAMRCIQTEEQTRVMKFIFKKDVKPALCGRLMIRKCISQALNVPYNKVFLGRSDKEKPILMNPKDDSFGFNISHQGDYCVLAAQQGKVGVDVMNYDYTRLSYLDSFFNNFDKILSNSEWDFVRLGPSDIAKLQRFYRLWALKESYLKAEGTGIPFGLSRISFHCPTVTLTQDSVVTDTIVYVDGCRLDDWIFEESLLDKDHCIAVACSLDDANDNYSLFKKININELLEDVIPLHESCDKSLWDSFAKKS